MFNRKLYPNSKDSVSSIFQNYDENTSNNNSSSSSQNGEKTILENNIISFNQMENHSIQKEYPRQKNILKEEEKLEQIINQENNKENEGRKIIYENNEKLNEEMEKIKDEQMKELKIREQICRDSVELKELRQKLHQAYINKEITLQLADKEAEKMEQKLIDEYYRNQLNSNNIKEAEEEEIYETDQQKRKVEYRKALEKQMQDEVDAKKQMKYKLYLQEQKITQNENDKILQEDEKARQEKISKMLKLRQEMEESIKLRAEIKQSEKLKRNEDEKKLESYWENNYKIEEEYKHEIEKKKEIITQRQEQCAKSLEEMNTRIQTKSDLLENINVLSSQLLDKENSEKQQNIEDINKKYKQEQLCYELDNQCAEKLRAKNTAIKNQNNFHEEWIWGDTNRSDIQAEKNRQNTRDIAEYNRQTMVTHKHQQKLDKIAAHNQEEEVLPSYESERQKLIEEERERLLKSQDPSVFQYLPSGTLKPEDLNKIPSEALDVIKKH